MKIYSLGVKFPYVKVSRLGKQLKEKGKKIMLMRTVRILGLFSRQVDLNLPKGEKM